MNIYIDDHRRSEVIAGVIIESDPMPHKGLGRWVDCKYCYKNVLPLLGGVNQVVCSQCGYGLTPDFFVFENLLAWLNGEDRTDEDMNSQEAANWFSARRLK